MPADLAVDALPSLTRVGAVRRIEVAEPKELLTGGGAGSAASGKRELTSLTTNACLKYPHGTDTQAARPSAASCFNCSQLLRNSFRILALARRDTEARQLLR